MKKIIPFCISILLASYCYSQESCNCEKALQQLIQKIETEYPGFNEKANNKLIYNNYKETLFMKARGIQESSCIELLQNYTGFFKDGHISISTTRVKQDDQLGIKGYDQVTIKQEDFQKRILKTTDPMEGVWRSGSYKVGIVKVNNEYQGFIIEADTTYWKANEIKFRLFENRKANYYLRDHSLSEEAYELVDGWILCFNATKFIKEQPKPNLSESEIKSKLIEIEGFYFKQITEKTSLICISSFEHSNVERIEKLIADNKSAIESSENLIIDVRNNSGGTDDAFAKLLPYINTNPTRVLSQEFLATQTTVDTYQQWLNTTPDNEENQADRKSAKEFIDKCKANMGKFVIPESTTIYISNVVLADHSPKQVIILANRNTASSGEGFVFKAKQSKKVKIMGTPTYGAIDYGTTDYFDFGCKNYSLMLPTWRSMRLPDYPIDNIGLQPDIYLDKSVKDWVQFAVDYLENK